ncbi:MAG: hypothetical protein AABY04_03640, partial [Candidatus Micrarchaeota archaeon]
SSPSDVVARREPMRTDEGASASPQHESLDVKLRSDADGNHPDPVYSLNIFSVSQNGVQSHAPANERREALNMMRRLINDIETSLDSVRDRAAGVALKREALEITRRLWAGVDNQVVASSLIDVGTALVAMGDRFAGVRLQRDAL